MSLPSNESSLLIGLVDRILSEESLDLEFKRAAGGLPNSIWETVSAFANTNGGWIVLGVNDSKDPPEIVGIPNASQLLQDFYNLMHNQQKLSQPVCGPNDASIETLDGKDLIVIRVPAAALRDRPVFINDNPYKGTHVRGHTGDFRCNRQDVNRMMREASDEAADSAVVRFLQVGDLEQSALRGYRQRFQNRNPESPFNAYNDEQFLHAIGALRRDSVSGEFGLTVAGLLLLGKPESIHQWRTRHLIEFRLVLDNSEWDHRWDDRVVCEGNLLDAFGILYNRLTADLPVGFRLDGPTRIDQSPIHVALREALVNLLVHADYLESRASIILRTANGFTFQNPGTSRVPVTDLGRRHDSDPRNPVLVRMFRQIGLADEAGSGMAKIFGAWNESSLLPPRFQVDTERYEFALHMPYIHLLSEEDLSWLASFGDDWSDAEQMALVHAKHEGFVDNRSLCRLTDLHPADATTCLGSLRDRGFLTMEGWARGTRYELSDPALEALTLVTTRVRTPSLGDNGTSMGDSGESLGDNDPSIGDNEEQILWDELMDIAQPARQQARLSRPELDKIIVNLTDRAWLSISQLHELTSRSPDHLRPRMRALAQAGRVQYRYPDNPRHPGQQYRTRNHHQT